jgi:hypothetical protein
MQAQQDQQFLQVNSLKQAKSGLFSFVGPSYQSWSPDADGQETLNMFVEFIESGTGKNKMALYGSPGISNFVSLPGSPIRGLFAGENRLFAVSGPNLCEVFQNQTFDNLGSIVNDGNPVYMEANGTGTQLCVAASYPSSTTNYTDIAINSANANEVSSAGNPFTALANAGTTLVITGGTGFTPGTYTILYVDGAGNAFLSAAAGTVSSTGGTGSLTINAGGYLYCDNGNGFGPVKQRFTVNYTDLTISASNVLIVSSAAQPFAADTDAGYDLTITGGPGFTPGTYLIVSVDDMGNATLNSGAGSEGSTGGTGIEYLSYVPAVQLAYLDTFFIVMADYTSRLFYLSASDDGTSWDALQVASKESYPDNINALITDHEEMWLFGSEESIEGWHNAGAAPFPFVRDDTAAMHYGIESPWVACRFMLGFCWLAKDQKRGGRVAMYAQGFQPVRISNHAVESIWNTYSTAEDCIAYSYEENGHPFYVLNFGTGNATWVYDGITNMWHQRGWWNGTANIRQRQAFHAYVNLGSGDAHYVGDWQNGNIYVQSISTYTDAGTQIQRIRTAPHISDENTINFHHRFRLDLETGNAAMNNIFLDWSSDGGYTFGQYGAVPGTLPSLGNPTSGTHGYSVVWTPLGAGGDRVFRLTILDPVKIAIVNAYLDVTAGTVPAGSGF